MKAMRSSLAVALGVSALLASAAVAGLSGSVPSRLTGSYVTQFPSSQHRIPAGKWKLDLHGTTATFHNPVSPRAVFSNALTVSGNRMTFGRDKLGCPTAGKGIYDYRLRSKRLTFMKVKDGCADRAYTLTAHPWTRVT